LSVSSFTTPNRPPEGPGAAAWRAARRVLCVRVDAMGDVLMTTAAMRALRTGGRSITLLTSPAGAELAPLVPEVDETIPYDAPWTKPGGGDAGADLAMVDRLAAGRFDAAVIFTVYSQSPLPAALLCRMAGIPLRLAHCRENPYDLLSDWVPEPEPDGGVRHEVRRQLDLVAAVGAATDDERLSLRVPAPARRRVDDLLRAEGIEPPEQFAVLHPGASAPSRRYPEEHFTDAARALSERHRVTLVLTGDGSEVALARRIAALVGPPVVSLAGRLPLPELAALLQRSQVLIAGNTGPVHVAAAVGTPVVDLYALTNPQHPPWGVPARVLYHWVPCRWCYRSVCPEGHHRCLRMIEPGEVVRAALELLHDPAAEPVSSALPP
jgi:ADP-heptose:LPS heptosyltransferase